MFISVDGKARKVAEIFAGGTDGKAHKVTQLFGSVGGVAKQLFSGTPKATNGFDEYSWAEIKQFANEGKLLEHFNLYDRVFIKLKTPLTNTLHIYLTGYGKYIDVPQYQSEMVFQIVELTETKMRLMCPRVSVLGLAASEWKYVSGTFKGDIIPNNGGARELVGSAWGMTPMYDALKTIQNSLPDDLLDVLSICARPIIKWDHHHITEKLETEFDEDMKVRQVTTHVWQRTVDTSNYDIVYPVIIESYYPTTVGEYLYHIQLPEEYDTYKQRHYMVTSTFIGLKFLDYECKLFTNSSYERDYNVTQSWCGTPYASCAFSKGITTNDDYEYFLSLGGVYNGINPPTFHDTIFPEIIIEADA